MSWTKIAAELATDPVVSDIEQDTKKRWRMALAMSALGLAGAGAAAWALGTNSGQKAVRGVSDTVFGKPKPAPGFMSNVAGAAASAPMAMTGLAAGALLPTRLGSMAIAPIAGQDVARRLNPNFGLTSLPAHLEKRVAEGDTKGVGRIQAKAVSELSSLNDPQFQRLKDLMYQSNKPGTKGHEVVEHVLTGQKPQPSQNVKTKWQDRLATAAGRVIDPVKDEYRRVTLGNALRRQVADIDSGAGSPALQSLLDTVRPAQPGQATNTPDRQKQLALGLARALEAHGKEGLSMKQRWGIAGTTAGLGLAGDLGRNWLSSPSIEESEQAQ
jgi:hypothetical protein